MTKKAHCGNNALTKKNLLTLYQKTKKNGETSKKNQGAINMNIGQRIKQFRLSQGMTQEQFGKLFGAGKGLVSRWENGLSIPSPKRMKTIANYMGTTPDDLVFNTFDCEVWINFGEGQLPKLLGAFKNRHEAELFVEFLKEGNYHKYAKYFEIKEI